MFIPYYVLLFLIYVTNVCFAETSKSVVYTYQEYQYKDNPKNEMTFREFETACEQSSACASLAGLQKTHCLRECISPSCFREIYQNDQLEEGEIDVRLNSFKGCFIQRASRSRS